MKNMEKTSKITDIMALTVFAVFSVCILLVLLTGADVYGSIVDRGTRDHDHRTAAQYISTRIRQGDDRGSLSVEDFGGTSALVLREEIRGKTYLTRVYCHDGFIRELFAGENGQFSPEDGEKILQAQALSFRLEENLLYVHMLLPDGTTQELTQFLRSTREVAP